MSTVRSLCFHAKLGIGTDASLSVIEIDVNENIVSEKSAAAEQLGIPFQGKESKQRHLDTYHLQEFVQFEDNLDKGRRLTPKINFALATNLQNQLDSCLVDLIVIDNLPLNTIRRPGFRSFALVDSFKLSIL